MKKRYASISILPVITLLLLLPSCSNVSHLFKTPRYRVYSFETGSRRPNDIRQKNNVLAKIRVLTPEECVDVFGKRGALIIKNRPRKRFIPCHISIKNNSSKSFILDPKDFSVQFISVERIIKRVQIFSPHRWIPALAFAYPAIPTIVPALALAGVTCVGMIRWSSFNEDLAVDLRKKVLDKAVTIHPQQQIDRIFFMKESDTKKKKISFTLYNEDTYEDTISFDLSL